MAATVLLVLSFLLVFFGSPFVVARLQRRGMVAEVVDRSSHANPTPSGGGILMVGVIAAMGLLAVTLADNIPHASFLTALFILSVPLAWVGWLDDCREQSAWLRLGIQVVCVVAALYFLPHLFDIFPLWFEKMVLLLAWVWFVNLYNFMDGLDGLATSEAIFLGVLVAILVPALAPVCLIIAGAALGFLRVNWQPAQVFMGDVASTFFGFVIGGLLLVGVEWDTWRLVYPLFTITLAFSGDTTYTLFKLLREGRKPWIPHRDFWFHRANKVGWSHQQVVFGFWGMNFGLALIAYGGFVLDAGPLTVITGLAWCALFALRVRRKENQSGDLAQDAEST